MQFYILFWTLDHFLISPRRWTSTLFILVIVFNGCLNAGPRWIPVILKNYRLDSGRSASFKTVPPPQDLQPLGGELGWCHGSLSRTISMVSVPPPSCFDETFSAYRYMRTHFLVTTEGSAWEAFLHGFKISGPLVFDAKKDWTLAGNIYPEFFLPGVCILTTESFLEALWTVARRNWCSTVFSSCFQVLRLCTEGENEGSAMFHATNRWAETSVPDSHLSFPLQTS